MLFCWTHVSVLAVSSWNLWCSLCTVSCHLQIKRVLLLPFQFGYLLFLLSYLISTPRTSSTTLSKSTKSRHPCLVLDLNGNTCSFCPLTMMLAIRLSYDIYYVKVWSLCSHFAVSFYHTCVLNFIKCFSYTCCYDHVIVILYFAYVVYPFL